MERHTLLKVDNSMLTMLAFSHGQESRHSVATISSTGNISVFFVNNVVSSKLSKAICVIHVIGTALLFCPDSARKPPSSPV